MLGGILHWQLGGQRALVCRCMMQQQDAGLDAEPPRQTSIAADVTRHGPLHVTEQSATASAGYLVGRVLAAQRGIPVVLHCVLSAAIDDLGNVCPLVADTLVGLNQLAFL